MSLSCWNNRDKNLVWQNAISHKMLATIWRTSAQCSARISLFLNFSVDTQLNKQMHAIDYTWHRKRSHVQTKTNTFPNTSHTYAPKHKLMGYNNNTTEKNPSVKRKFSSDLQVHWHIAWYRRGDWMSENGRWTSSWEREKTRHQN